MKIEFENLIRRLSFLCHLPEVKTAWINLVAEANQTIDCNLSQSKIQNEAAASYQK